MTSPGAIKTGGAILLLIASSLRLLFGDATQVFRSGDGHVALLELYTSEGCSSCPPAEAWFSSLKSNAFLWKRFVPVAFHVDYWNYLGWADPYSSADYSNRQRAYGNAWQKAGIYTPEFVLDGREWRSDSMEISSPSAGNYGSLSVTVTAGGKVGILYKTAIRPTTPFVAELALLGGGISSAVSSGENSGKTLHHDFLALVLIESALRASENGTYKTEITLPKHSSIPPQAIAIWIRNEQNQIPIQAAGGWLTPFKLESGASKDFKE